MASSDKYMAQLRCMLFLGAAAIGSTSLAARAESGGNIQVDSQPANADVYVMGKPVGKTPLMINERDIYPISYDTDHEALYGMVVLRKQGCEDYARRLTRSDVSTGLIAQLTCGETSPPATAAPPAPPPEVPRTEPVRPQAPPAAAGPPSDLLELRLGQLRAIQQLNDDGLISDAEEKSLRKRILESLTEAQTLE